MIAYKFLRPNGTSVFTRFTWPLPDGGRGPWVDASVDPCRSGIHACRRAELPLWLGRTLYEIELDGEIVEEATKLVAPRGRLLRRIDAWDEATRDEYTRMCADRAHELARAEGLSSGTRSWSSPCPRDRRSSASSRHASPRRSPAPPPTTLNGAARPTGSPSASPSSSRRADRRGGGDSCHGDPRVLIGVERDASTRLSSPSPSPILSRPKDETSGPNADQATAQPRASRAPAAEHAMAGPAGAAAYGWTGNDHLRPRARRARRSLPTSGQAPS